MTVSGLAERRVDAALVDQEGQGRRHLRRADPARLGEVEAAGHRRDRRRARQVQPGQGRQVLGARAHGEGWVAVGLVADHYSPHFVSSRDRPPLRHPHPADRGDARRDGAGRGRRRRLRRGPDRARARGAGRRAVRARGGALHADRVDGQRAGGRLAGRAGPGGALRVVGAHRPRRARRARRDRRDHDAHLDAPAGPPGPAGDPVDCSRPTWARSSCAPRRSRSRTPTTSPAARCCRSTTSRSCAPGRPASVPACTSTAPGSGTRTSPPAYPLVEYGAVADVLVGLPVQGARRPGRLADGGLARRDRRGAGAAQADGRRHAPGRHPGRGRAARPRPPRRAAGRGPRARPAAGRGLRRRPRHRRHQHRRGRAQRRGGVRRGRRARQGVRVAAVGPTRRPDGHPPRRVAARTPKRAAAVLARL